MKHQLPKLAYAYDALEPWIDAKTMEIHHSKHHQGYVDKLNIALGKYPELFEKKIEELLAGNLKIVPDEIKTAVRNNGGGHLNHTIFWQIMAPDAGGEPSGELAETIKEKFGSFDKFKEHFSAVALGHFGSGWAWLVLNDKNELEVATMSNQDHPAMVGRRVVFGIDVWEHAYYLKHQNKRVDYIKDWWNVVNWSAIESRYADLKR